MKDIYDLTMIQFNNIVEGISRKQHFELVLSCVAQTGKIEESDFPFHTKEIVEGKKLKMSDVEKMMEELNK